VFPVRYELNFIYYVDRHHGSNGWIQYRCIINVVLHVSPVPSLRPLKKTKKIKAFAHLYRIQKVKIWDILTEFQSHEPNVRITYEIKRRLLCPSKVFLGLCRLVNGSQRFGEICSSCLDGFKRAFETSPLFRICCIQVCLMIR
jgi:hypothetical protein